MGNNGSFLSPFCGLDWSALATFPICQFLLGASKQGHSSCAVAAKGSQANSYKYRIGNRKADPTNRNQENTELKKMWSDNN